VSGTVALSGLNREPRLDVDLTLPFVRLGELFFDGHVVAHVAPKRSEASGDAETASGDEAAAHKEEASATLEIDLEGQDGGVLQVLAFAGAKWKGLTVPVLDPDSSGGLALSAKGFRLGAAFPVVSEYLSKLDGVIDGTARLAWGRVSDVDEGKIDGLLRVRDAVVFIPQFGQELKRGKATIIANPAGVVRIENVEAGGITGRVHGGVLGRFDGLLFRGAKGEIAIDEGQEIPITFEGVPVGAASGKIGLDATYDAGEIGVHAQASKVKIALPSSTARGVQDLGDDPTIRLSAPLGPPKEPRAKDALRYALTVDLERMQVTGSGLEAVVHSAPNAPIVVRLADEVKVGGDILFDRGYVVLQQKKFEVDTGLIRLREEEAGNPFVNLTAHWDGTDGGRVYVDYVGDLEPITDDKIRFRSDPPHTKQEIIATLLFGNELPTTPSATTGSTTTSSGPDAAGIATEVGGSVASQALNALLSSRFVTLTVDRGSDGGLRGKVEWRATEGLTFGLSGQQVQATTSAASSSTGPSATGTGGAQGELSLDWHFLKNWSLRSTVGAGVRDPSTGIDVLWQYRY
jgi:translocation and assembly module TamB